MRILCADCDKEVDEIAENVDPFSLHRRYIVRCHRKEATFMISLAALMVREPLEVIVFFTKENQ